MILLNAALTGELAGDPLDDEIRHSLADAAFHALAVAADQFVEQTGRAEHGVIARLLIEERAAAATALLDKNHPEVPPWIRSVAIVLETLSQVSASLRANGSERAMNALAEVEQAVIAFTAMNADALTNRIGVAALLKSDIPKLVTSYGSFGVLHHAIVRDAMAFATYERAAPPPGVAGGEVLLSEALQLLDAAEAICSEGRDATRLADVFLAAQMALPLFAAGLRLLKEAALRHRQARVDIPADAIKEEGVAEEHRVACVEMLVQFGQMQTDAILSVGALRARFGATVAELLREGAREAAARVPYFPRRFRLALDRVGKDVETLGSYPYSDAQRFRILGLLHRRIEACFRESFCDVHVVEAFLEHYRTLSQFGRFRGPEDEERGTSLLDEQQEREEAKAALAVAQRALNDGDETAAIAACSVARRLGSLDVRLQAALLQADLYVRRSEDAYADELYREVVASGEVALATAAAANFAVFLVQRNREGAEPLFELAMTSADPRVSAHAALNLGMLRARSGDAEGAISAFRTAVAKNDQEWSSVAAIQLSKTLANLGDIDAAIASCETAARFGHADWSHRAILAAALLELATGRTSESRARLMAAVNPASGDFQRIIGEVLMALPFENTQRSPG